MTDASGDVFVLDSVIELTGDWFSPAKNAASDSDIVETLGEQMEAQNALLLGRKTVVSFRGRLRHGSCWSGAAAIRDHAVTQVADG